MTDERHVGESPLGDAFDEATVAKIHRRIEQTRRSRGAPSARRTWSLGLAAAAVLAIAVLAARREERRHAGPLGLRDASGATRPLAARLATPASAVALDDGSRIVLAHDADLELVANDGERFVTWLNRGRVRFDVQPGGPRRWTIETELGNVEVVGTAFVVDRRANALRVEVDHGVVVVRGAHVPGRTRRLTRGQSMTITAPAAARRDEVPSPAPAVLAPPSPATVDAAPTPPRTRTGGPSEGSASRRRSAAPLPRVEPSSPDNDAEDRASPTALALGAADEARARGAPAEAAEILRRAVALEREPGSRMVLALSLGRLEYDVLRRPDRAAEVFEMAAMSTAAPTLAADASVRAVEAWLAAGRPDRARAIRARYSPRAEGDPRVRVMDRMLSATP